MIRKGLTIALCLLAFGCARQESGEERPDDSEAEGTTNSGFEPVTGTPNPDAESLSARTRRAHKMADDAVTREDKAAAAVRLETLFQDMKAESTPHVTAVRQDLAARGAHLALASGDPKKARRLAEAGLQLSESPTVLRANLLIAFADAAEKLGDRDATRQALLDALVINQKLFNAELETP